MKISRKPPWVGKLSDSAQISVYAFEKNEGSVSSTFIGRLIRRNAVRLQLRSGDVINVVRYAGRYWPIYQPDTFPENCKRWVNVDDRIYDENYTELKLPLRYAYLFEGDEPKGLYY